jgi:hypothetical protein
MKIAHCTHPRARHKHGTYLAHDKDGCRCLPCALAASRKGKETRYRTATGTHTYVDAESARRHVRSLTEVLTFAQIEGRSGVNRTALRALLGTGGRKPSRRVTRTTRDALLAVQPDVVGIEHSGLVDATGTRRRMQALVAAGWSTEEQRRRLGFSSATTHKITTGIRGVVTVRVRDAVRRLFDELALVVPEPGQGATLARKRAVANGWPPPLAWDDDIDNPAATPAEGWDAVEARDVGLEEWWRLVRYGEDPARAAWRVGVGLSAIEKRAYRIGSKEMRVVATKARLDARSA